MSASASPSVTAPPARRRAWILRVGVALVLLALAAWGLFTWAFYNPLESEVPRVERLIPASAGWVVRGSGEALLRTPFVRRFVLERPEARQVLEDWRLSGLPAEIDAFERNLNVELPGPLRGFSLAADVFGRDAVAFGITDLEDVTRSRFAVATRLTPRARLMVAALKHGFVRRRIEAASAVRFNRTPLVTEVDLAAFVEDPALGSTGYIALVRDVFVAGNDRELVMEAVRLGRGESAGALVDRAYAREAIEGGDDAPLAAFLDVAALSADMEAAGQPTLSDRARGADGLAGVAALLVDPAALATLGARVSFPGPAECRIDVRGVRGGTALEGAPGMLAEAPPAAAGAALAEAAALAPAGSAWLVARVELPAGVLLRMIAGRMSPAIRREIESGLRAAGTSLENVERDADDVLLPGASLVFERLPDCDGLALDTYGAGPDGRFVTPLPGVLLALRQRPGLSAGSAERFLRRAREWGEFRTFEDLGPLEHGMTGFRAEPKFLTGDLELVKPAAAFDGDLVLVASNEGLLRRALDARAGRIANLSDFPGFADDAAAAGEGQVVAFVEAGALTAHLRDLRRDVATERSARDWTEERRNVYARIVRERLSAREVVTDADVQPLVDEEMARLTERNRTVEFRDAMAAYLRELEGMAPLRAVAAGLLWEHGGGRLRLVVRATE